MYNALSVMLTVLQEKELNIEYNIAKEDCRTATDKSTALLARKNRERTEEEGACR
jgi:hypothetical protein